MKKIYKTPQTKTVLIATTLMSGVSGTLDRNQSITNSDAFGSRRGGGSWDEDED